MFRFSLQKFSQTDGLQNPYSVYLTIPFAGIIILSEMLK